MYLLLILLIIVVLFFRKESFSLDPYDRMNAYLKTDRKYINQIDYYQPQGLDYKDAPNIDLERAIYNSPIRSDDINWEKLNDYDYARMVGLLQGNYNRPLIKSINAS
jgi:hypothetical protein